MKKEKKVSANDEGNSVLVSFRCHKTLVQELDALIPAFGENATLCPSGAATRTDVLRWLLVRGLIEWRKDHGE